MKSKEFTNYANSFQAIARLELKSITRLLDFLGHPEDDIEFIHIAGTNGKGSVCAFLQEIFSYSGYKCGKYISPNMVSVCERISIDGKEIKEEELERILERVKIASDKVIADTGDTPTQFEIWTAAAFYYFKEQNCDLVILETGLGGAQDATNVIKAPKASVITRIDLDHTEYLGDTIEKVAKEKTGIIKSREDGSSKTVTTLQDERVMDVLKDQCKIKNNKLFVAEKPAVHSPLGTKETFSYKHLKNLVLGISGYHQIENACIAIETALCLGIDDEAIRSGLYNAKNIGRFEILRKDPTLIFDGAHNPNGMESLIFSLKRYFPDKTPLFIMGTMADKDISKNLQIIKREYSSSKIFAVSVKDNPRAMNREKLAGILAQNGFLTKDYESIKDAIKDAENESYLTVICGSLYLYKDYKTMD